jgi:hypothetical protein
MRMAASFSGSAKPSNVLLVTIPGGGTSPTREPGGKIASAAVAEVAQTVEKTVEDTIRASAAATLETRIEREVQWPSMPSLY